MGETQMYDLDDYYDRRDTENDDHGRVSGIYDGEGVWIEFYAFANGDELTDITIENVRILDVPVDLRDLPIHLRNAMHDRWEDVEFS